MARLEKLSPMLDPQRSKLCATAQVVKDGGSLTKSKPQGANALE